MSSVDYAYRPKALREKAKLSSQLTTELTNEIEKIVELMRKEAETPKNDVRLTLITDCCESIRAYQQEMLG